MYEIQYKPSFIRQYKKLDEGLKNDVKRTLELLKVDPKNPLLKSHKLKGKLIGCWSCSVNFSYRLIFEYEKTLVITCLAVGDHNVYR